jgi:alpha-N-arabinofuranosidase
MSLGNQIFNNSPTLFFFKFSNHTYADMSHYFFIGGCFVEGEWLRNAFRWRETIGPWEERPGHYGDVWKYWTDDGLGYYEFLQVCID